MQLVENEERIFEIEFNKLELDIFQKNNVIIDMKK